MGEGGREGVREGESGHRRIRGEDGGGGGGGAAAPGASGQGRRGGRSYLGPAC